MKLFAFTLGLAASLAAQASFAGQNYVCDNDEYGVEFLYEIGGQKGELNVGSNKVALTCAEASKIQSAAVLKVLEQKNITGIDICFGQVPSGSLNAVTSKNGSKVEALLFVLNGEGEMTEDIGTTCKPVGKPY